jgi:glucosamine-6-phosphate deaminase
MRILVGTPEEAAEAGADLVLATVAEGARVLGVATGSSPQPLYRELALRRSRGFDFSHLSAFALDEYVGIEPAHPESYRSVISHDVTGPLGLDPARVRVPPGDASDTEVAAAEYERAILAAGGVDLQILGIGANGHIGFNEPGSSVHSRTRVVELAPATRNDNARYFGGDPDQVPGRAMTQGIATILDARRLVLLATGATKAAAIAEAFLGPVTDDVPASHIRSHRDATIILDYAAAAGLPAEAVEYLEHGAAQSAPSD